MKKEILSAIKLYLEAFRIPQVRKKILVTALFLFIFRLIVHIPSPGINREILKSFFERNQFLALLDIFSGGTLANFSICALGLNPYINASVMFQLLGFVFPKIRELQKEGEYGRQKIARYTRLATIPLAMLQAIGMYALLKSQGVMTNLSPLYLVSFVVTIVTGTMIMMFLGELINEYGLGNGISLLIFAGIVSQYPVSVARTISVTSQQNIFGLVGFLIMSVVVIAGITFVDEAFLRVPVQYARRSTVGRTAVQGSFLPLKINTAGVMPIIFALSLVSIPSTLGRLLGQAGSWLGQIGRFFASVFNVESLVYNLLYFALVVVFSYFYTTVVFNPKEVAENLRKSGGFIPGVRPGISTEKRLGFLLSRVTVIGSMFLGAIAVLPALTQKMTGISTISLGGTGILIVVSVIIELHRLLENLVQTWRYQNYY